MKAHVGVDSKSTLIHTVLASAANVHDREAVQYLLHGAETRVWATRGITATRTSFTGAHRGPRTSRTSAIGSTGKSTK
jgi:IS5 family transposase